MPYFLEGFHYFQSDKSILSILYFLVYLLDLCFILGFCSCCQFGSFFLSMRMHACLSTAAFLGLCCGPLAIIMASLFLKSSLFSSFFAGGGCLSSFFVCSCFSSIFTTFCFYSGYGSFFTSGFSCGFSSTFGFGTYSFA